MKREATTEALARSMHAQVRTLRPRTDPEALLARIERRRARDRRLVVGGMLLALVAAVGAGFFVGRDTVDEQGQTTVAIADGTPGPRPADVPLEPADVDKARAAVIQAFEDAYTGSTSQAVKNDAIQLGQELGPLTRRAVAYAELHGYTREQLAAVTIQVAGVTFIDAEHAAVQFTLDVPGHGPTLVDRVGYAVLVDGRWRVSLRTACDLLSLGGLSETCRPTR